jgi:transcription-repair coupling factor (superfamily II helicase)
LSRFKNAKESKLILSEVASGKIDVIIGTHRLLSNDIGFKKIGLMVIDEEQKFGVAHKEKLKKLRHNLHILTLTATPIPRTLHMGLSGLKEISIIATPPTDRLSVRTHIVRKNMDIVREAIVNEISRGGQVFYIHNRIQDLEKEFLELQKILPDVSIDRVHGQMDDTKIEDVMNRFYQGNIQVLVSTAIVESGLDVPNANTLIVDRADMFGLSQLYQLRGRVGRSDKRAHAYLLLPEKKPITQDAEERMSVLESYQDLGSGFHIASHDLDIRGAGDLLGGNQSGHVLTVGMDTYMELLEQAIAEGRGDDPVSQKVDPDITIGIDITIPNDFVADPSHRLLFYRRLANALDENEVEEIRLEIMDRFGSPPQSVSNLVAIMRIKCQLRRLGVRSLTASKIGYSLIFDVETPVKPARLVASVSRYPHLFSLFPDGKVLIKGENTENDAIGSMRGVEGALSLIESWCE